VTLFLFAGLVFATSASAGTVRVSESFLDVQSLQAIGAIDPIRESIVDAAVAAFTAFDETSILLDDYTGAEAIRVRNLLFDGQAAEIDTLARADVGPNFGIVTDSRAVAKFDLESWVAGPPDISTYDDVVVTLLALDTDGGHEVILSEEGLVGFLAPGSGFTVQSDLFGTVRLSLREDGRLNLRVKPLGSGNTIQLLGARVAANVEVPDGEESGGGGVTPIPEPAAAAFFCLGLLIVGRATRRR